MSNNKIQYTNLTSPLGDMSAVATNKGVCFLEWQDRGGVERILTRVTKRYKMPLVENSDNRYLHQLKKELAEYFAGNLTEFKVTIDVTGTPFEQKVWKNLNKIPFGETRSYAQLAELVDKPKASRAVGRANGANYLSILIPCHRVITSDGGLGGYGGKIWRKKHLLELEQKVSKTYQAPLL